MKISDIQPLGNKLRFLVAPLLRKEKRCKSLNFKHQSAATREAMENARRFAHIWDMQAAIYELQLIEMAQRFSNKSGGESEGDEQ